MADPSLFARVAGNALYYGGMYAASRYLGGNARKRGIGGANFQGSFGGSVKRPKSSKLGYGYAERVTFAGVASQSQCCYLGFTSLPTATYSTGGLYSRMLQDICIAILRDFFKKYHPGRAEFQTPDQDLYTSLGYADEKFEVVFRTPGSASQLVVGLTTPTAANGTTLRAMAANMASVIMTNWKDGLEPFILQSRVNLTGVTTVPRAVMWLNNLVVSAKCTNVVIIQNQSLADDGATADLDANTTVDVSANPLKGRMFYMKHVAPEVCTGAAIDNNDPTLSDDRWGFTNLRNSELGTLKNVFAPSTAATGCWVTIPKAEYFKNCTGIKDIGLEPGVQKTFKLRFKFNGPLTNYLRGEYSNYYSNTTTGPAVSAQSAYKQKFGQCVLLAFEKRLRQTGSAITVAYQVDTYMRCSIKQKRQYMTYHVETNV